jgi:methyl-accepting chemotaxis protein
MSATSEQLAAQAEQLQASIAYFRTDASGTALVVAETARREPAAKTRPKPAQPIAVRRRPSVATPVRVSARRGGDAPERAGAGVALNLLNGGHDADDAAFERY